MINEIKNTAKNKGACAKTVKATTFKELAELFFSAQGQEFCSENKFPSISTFRAIKNDVAKYGILVDCEAVKRKNDKYIALIGDTQAELIFDGNTHINTVILMHGSKAVINATNYAVINVVNVGCEVEINKDGTVILL